MAIISGILQAEAIQRRTVMSSKKKKKKKRP
jgi:hypothetical protein